MRFTNPPNKWAERASRSLAESCEKRRQEMAREAVTTVYVCIYCGKLLTEAAAVPCVHGWMCATCVDEADDEGRQQ